MWELFIKLRKKHDNYLYKKLGNYLQRNVATI